MTEKKLRTVKSFVRRQGRMSQTKKEALQNDWLKWGLSTTNGMLDFNNVFTERGPIILEIGFGMGDSLSKMAQVETDSRFIGIEVHTPGIANLLANIENHQLTNIRIFHEDALIVLNESIPDASLNRVQLFFPDPWPKLRHHKRRIVQPEFVALIAKKLKPKGIFHLATDWEDYAKHMLTVLQASADFTNQHAESIYAPRPEWRPLTKFEQRGQRLGHGIWDLLFLKK